MEEGKKNKGGRPPKIETPDELLGYFEQYKSWCKGTPRVENVFSQKTGQTVSVPRERPLNWQRFEVWLSEQGILADLDKYRYATYDHHKKFSGIVKRIGNEIYADKIEGATVGIYNSSIVIRELGLAEKQEIKVQEELPLFPDL